MSSGTRSRRAPVPAAPVPVVLAETQSRSYAGRGQTARPARFVNSTGIRAVGAHFGNALHFLARETAPAAYEVYALSQNPDQAIQAGISNANMVFDSVEALFKELPESLADGETFDVEPVLEDILAIIVEQRNLAADAATAYAVRTHFSRHSFIITGLRNAVINEAAASARNNAVAAAPVASRPPAPAASTWPAQRRTGARVEWHDDDEA